MGILKLSERAVLIIVILTVCGCGSIAPSSQPFDEPLRDISIGQTVRAEVHDLLGVPERSGGDGAWDFYEDRSGAFGHLLMIPVYSSDDWRHILLVVYDEFDRVQAYSRGGYGSESYYGKSLLCAGEYCYARHPNRIIGDKIFRSFDSGEKADANWSYYVFRGSKEARAYTVQHQGQDSRFAGGYALKDLCDATIAGHPCAYLEVGNYFWAGSYDKIQSTRENCGQSNWPAMWTAVQSDNVTACAWYALGNSGTLPQWCIDDLSASEVAEVERLVPDWKPRQCREQLDQYRCGIFGNAVCE